MRYRDKADKKPFFTELCRKVSRLLPASCAYAKPFKGGAVVSVLMLEKGWVDVRVEFNPYVYVGVLARRVASMADLVAGNSERSGADRGGGAGSGEGGAETGVAFRPSFFQETNI